MNPWNELEIEEGASKHQIEGAFRRLAHRWHPDRCRLPGAEEKMKRLNHARDMLLHPERVPKAVVVRRRTVHVRSFGQTGGFTGFRFSTTTSNDSGSTNAGYF